MDEELVFRAVVWTVIIGSICFFIALQLLGIRAQYGRFYSPGSSTSAQRGFLSRLAFGPVPGQLAWVCQELPALLMPVVAIARFDPPSTAAYILIFCFFFHYFNRTLVFPFFIRGGKPTDGHVMLTAFWLQLANGYIQARAHTGLVASPEDWHTSVQFRCGTLVFFFGMGLNIWSDSILRNLRKAKADTSYQLPSAGLFRHVTSANYFGELIQWTGYAIACNSLAGFSFAFMTACNLIPRALQHHAWYVATFGADALRARKAILPFIL